jgi:hypothetical protein
VTAQPFNYFAALAAHVGGQAQPNHKGEVWITCPNCGKSQKHFSFSERGAKCFTCGYHPSLKSLAERLGVQDARPYAPPAPVRQPKARPWKNQAEMLARSLAETPGLAVAWRAYKPVSAATLRQYQLGYGIFPGGLWDEKNKRRCHHPRLIVPLWDAAAFPWRATGFRCRRTTCDCATWLSPAGSELTLYNAHKLRPGLDVVVICENPVDALLVKQEWEGVAVATLGVSVWKDYYAALLQQAAPEQVVVWFDNDVAGQCTNPAYIAAWKAERRARGLPDDETKFLAGIALTNRLIAAGLKATFYPWPESARYGADLGEFFK